MSYFGRVKISVLILTLLGASLLIYGQRGKTPKVKAEFSCPAGQEICWDSRKLSFMPIYKDDVDNEASEPDGTPGKGIADVVTNLKWGWSVAATGEHTPMQYMVQYKVKGASQWIEGTGWMDNTDVEITMIDRGHPSDRDYDIKTYQMPESLKDTAGAAAALNINQQWEFRVIAKDSEGHTTEAASFNPNRTIENWQSLYNYQCLGDGSDIYLNDKIVSRFDDTYPFAGWIYIAEASGAARPGIRVDSGSFWYYWDPDPNVSQLKIGSTISVLKGEMFDLMSPGDDRPSQKRVSGGELQINSAVPPVYVKAMGPIPDNGSIGGGATPCMGLTTDPLFVKDYQNYYEYFQGTGGVTKARETHAKTGPYNMSMLVSMTGTVQYAMSDEYYFILGNGNYTNMNEPQCPYYVMRGDYQYCSMGFAYEPETIDEMITTYGVRVMIGETNSFCNIREGDRVSVKGLVTGTNTINASDGHNHPVRTIEVFHQPSDYDPGAGGWFRCSSDIQEYTSFTDDEPPYFYVNPDYSAYPGDNQLHITSLTAATKPEGITLPYVLEWDPAHDNNGVISKYTVRWKKVEYQYIESGGSSGPGWYWVGIGPWQQKNTTGSNPQLPFGPTELTPGANYKVQIKAFDTTGNYSEWTAGRATNPSHRIYVNPIQPPGP